MDQLATGARSIYTIHQLKIKPGYVFPRAKAVCTINGRLENNNLYLVLKNTISNHVFHDYLLAKYDWSQASFNKKCWRANGRELQRLSKARKVTVIKYIHGWLANNKRQFFTPKSIDKMSPLCGNIEDRRHLFCCPNDRAQELREKSLEGLIRYLCNGTVHGFQQVFSSGIQSVFGYSGLDDHTMLDWPIDLKDAYDTQSCIGWEQVMYGRMSRQWDTLKQYRIQQCHSTNSFQWTSKVIRLC